MNNEPYENMVKSTIDKFETAFKNQDINKILKKTMFGTDYFGIGSGFDAVDEYIYTLDTLFRKENQKLYLYKTCLNKLLIKTNLS